MSPRGGHECAEKPENESVSAQHKKVTSLRGVSSTKREAATGKERRKTEEKSMNGTRVAGEEDRNPKEKLQQP